MNKVLLLGRLGVDPEVKQTPGGASVLSLSLATSRRYKDKTTGEKKEVTEWHRCIFWNKAADLVGEYCKKGHRLFVEGRLETRKWQDKEGVERYTTEVLVDGFEFVESGGGHSIGGVPVPSDEDAPADNFNDDIPF